MRTEDDVASVEQSTEEDPNEMVSQCAQHLKLCQYTLLKILPKDLGFRAYKINLVQNLKLMETATYPDFHKNFRSAMVW